MPSVATWWARRAALRELDAGSLSAAEEWLAWGAWFDSADGRMDLIRAACFRHAGDRAAWESALAAAERRGAGVAEVDLERRLGEIRWGAAARLSLADFDGLMDAGISSHDAAVTCVQGFIARGELPQARQLAEEQAQALSQAQSAYLTGLCEWSERDRPAARAQFEAALEQEPRHEPARAALARLLEEGYDFAGALPHYATLAAAADREAARVDLARILRKLGGLAAARKALAGPSIPEDASSALLLELAEIELESGNYQAAQEWFERADLEASHFADTLRAAATATGLAGSPVAAAALFRRVDEAQAYSRQLGEVQRRLAIDSTDAVAAADLDVLQRGSPTPDVSPLLADAAASAAGMLYAEHCAACHGATGAGDGPAARHLHPRPRNLRRERHRLVSTQNGVPTLADTGRVIRLGMPGTSMPSFADLSEDERTRLAAHVQQLRREGIRERLVEELQAAGEPADDDELRQIVAELTTPGDQIDMPIIGPADRRSLARGRELYVEAGCARCHGDDGRGEVDLLLFDETGRLVAPRDLVRDPLKGGDEPQDLYRRLKLGMPGTPHPAALDLDDADAIALVHYCRSLSVEPKPVLTNHERALDAARDGEYPDDTRAASPAPQPATGRDETR